MFNKQFFVGMTIQLSIIIIVLYLCICSQGGKIQKMKKAQKEFEKQLIENGIAYNSIDSDGIISFNLVKIESGKIKN